ncbi:Sodium-coupled monocarboxylate transporter 2 [Portunus trituberculatus]|uniref:Sodium-coupled monocarboxylate transporter 2 n=1 Tax=Portunus trituberculatus TaxID=210409 RepID=A0A5B7DCD6_PORTR|nr:Sodium-coupled monocarboxylate transporter 2 [Portunus trituberculatus]
MPQRPNLAKYVELRYKSRKLRLLATLCNLLNKFFYMGICLYAPSLALSTVTKLSTWTSMGGVKAVVYTDVMQTLLMFIGLIVVIVVCCLDLGGFSNVWSAADEGGRLELFKLVISFVVMLYVLWLLCFSAGLVAYATYQDCDPITSNRVKKPDQILPYLVMEKLTRFPGMPGVFVAAVYGGVLRRLYTIAIKLNPDKSSILTSNTLH